MPRPPVFKYAATLWRLVCLLLSECSIIDSRLKLGELVNRIQAKTYLLCVRDRMNKHLFRYLFRFLRRLFDITSATLSGSYSVSVAVRGLVKLLHSMSTLPEICSVKSHILDRRILEVSHT